MADIEKKAILFICTGNAGRSQMAQAMFRDIIKDKAIVESAGVEPWGDLHSMAKSLMIEKGLSLEGHYPKSARSVAKQEFDFVVTIGDQAKLQIPEELQKKGQWIHWDISDPADADGTNESEVVFRRTAEEIASRFQVLLDRFLL
jgi:protein-tyrosine-phosphatase